MKEEEKLRAYISDVWKEIDHILRNGSDSELLGTWMNVLGIMQSKAAAFGISRDYIGIPMIDADALFLQYSIDKN